MSESVPRVRVRLRLRGVRVRVTGAMCDGDEVCCTNVGVCAAVCCRVLPRGAVHEVQYAVFPPSQLLSIAFP